MQHEQLELFPRNEIEAYRVPFFSNSGGGAYWYIDVGMMYTNKHILHFYAPSGETYTYRLQNIRSTPKPV